MIYSQLSNLSGSGAIDPEYMEAGQECYKAFIVAKGLYDEPRWEDLVWAEQYAWCQAARTARNYIKK